MGKVIQRRFPRFPIKLPVLYKVLKPTPSKPGVGWTRDLGEEGACLELTDRLEPSTVLWVLLRSDVGGLELTAQVIWSGRQRSEKEGIPHGVSFTPTTPDQQLALRDVLVRHKVQLPQAGVRVPVEISVTCRPKDGAGPIVEGRTGDISRGGLLLHLPVSIPPRTVLSITILTARGEIEAEGEIAWVEPVEEKVSGKTIQHGFRFTEITWPNQLTLGLLLAEAP